MIEIRRVVVALDTDERTLRIVREAVRVAACFDTEIEGLFVEDEELLALARSSFARRTGTAATTRAFDVSDVEREWRTLARSVRSTLEREAMASRVETRFAVQRGPAPQAIRERLEGGDLVVIGWGGWSPAGKKSAPIRVLFDHSGSAERALEIGARLASREGELAIWVVDADETALNEVRARVRDVGHSRVTPITDLSISSIQGIVAEQPGGLLIIPSGSDVAARLAQRAVEARFPAGVLIVR